MTWFAADPVKREAKPFLPLVLSGRRASILSFSPGAQEILFATDVTFSNVPRNLDQIKYWTIDRNGRNLRYLGQGPSAVQGFTWPSAKTKRDAALSKVNIPAKQIELEPIIGTGSGDSRKIFKGQLSGYVQETLGGQPISGAEIWLWKKDNVLNWAGGIKTDAHGFFFLTMVFPVTGLPRRKQCGWTRIPLR